MLPPEKITLLKSWRNAHKKVRCFLIEYTPECAIVLIPGKNGDDRLYGVKGMSNSLSAIMQRSLPAIIETVLLPFGDEIIYDGYINSMPIGFGEGMLPVISEWTEKAKTHEVVMSI
jgi:hypothetical protein